jgi:hypothetical protein
MSGHLVSLVLMALLATAVQAQVYKWTDAKGQVVFGNNPDEHLNAEQVQLGEPSIYSPAEPGITQVQVKQLYRLELISPSSAGPVLSPQGELLIEVELRPAVASGLSYGYFIDGNLVAQDPAPRIRLQGLEAGEYRVRVRVTDRGDKPLAETAEAVIRLTR